MKNQKRILKKVRDIGKEMTDVVNCIQGTNEKQYMVAYLVSENELKTGNSCIDSLHGIQTQFSELVQKGTINLDEKGHMFGRFVFFMNLYDKNTSFSYQHTEKRFFDPNNTLLQAGDHGLFPYGYLVPMLTSLRRDRGSEWTNHRLLIFTYYIPCSHSQHQCAKLIKRYAERTGCKMTIGWITSYKSTDEEESITEMSCENINIIKLDGSESNSVSTFLNELRGGFQRKPRPNFPPQLGAFLNGQYDGYQWKPEQNIPSHTGVSWNGQHNGFQPRLGQNMPPHMGASLNGQHNGFQQKLGQNMPPYIGASWNGQQNGFQQTLGPNMPSHMGASLNGQHNGFQQKLGQNMPPHIGASWNGQHNGFQQKLGQNLPPHMGASWNGQGASSNGDLSLIAFLLTVALSKQTTSIWS